VQGFLRKRAPGLDIQQSDIRNPLLFCGSIRASAQLVLRSPAQLEAANAAISDTEALDQYVVTWVGENVQPRPSPSPGQSPPAVVGAPPAESPSPSRPPSKQSPQPEESPSPVPSPEVGKPSPAPSPKPADPEKPTEAPDGKPVMPSPLLPGGPRNGSDPPGSSGPLPLPDTEQKPAANQPQNGSQYAPLPKAVPQELVTGISIAASTMTTVTAAVTIATSVLSTVISAVAASATATVTIGSSVVVTVTAAIAQQGAILMQSVGGAQPAAATAATQARTMGAVLKAPNMQALSKVASKGSGLGVLFTLSQMQSIGTTGFMAPADMPGFKAVAGSMDWTVQLPVPFWDLTGGWWVGGWAAHHSPD
jgi:hypothetical protein